jgi:hypothetical protein
MPLHLASEEQRACIGNKMGEKGTRLRAGMAVIDLFIDFIVTTRVAKGSLHSPRRAVITIR